MSISENADTVRDSGNNSLTPATTAARRRSLYVLREILRLSPESASDLLSLDAEIATRAFDALPVRLSGAACFLDLKLKGICDWELLSRFLSVFRTTLNSPTTITKIMRGTGILALGRCDDLDRIAGPKYFETLVHDEGSIANALVLGVDLIRKVSPDLLTSIFASADICAGLSGMRGEIRAFSNVNVPGLLAISVDNPPVLISEQIVHEAAHNELALLLENSNELEEIVFGLPPCYSPFAETVRSGERVLHGVLSYGAVLRFWRSLANYSDLDPTWLDQNSVPDARQVISARIAKLRTRVQLGWQSLVCATRDSEREQLRGFCGSFLGYEPTSMQPEDEREPIQTHLGPIERAEFCLAAAGSKISRIVLPIGASEIHTALVISRVPHCYSSRAFSQKCDDKLAGFSNAFMGWVDILNAEARHDVLCYIANTVDDVRDTSELDGDGAAGQKFGIPQCCQDYFRRHWPLRGDDLFAVLLNRTEFGGTVRLPWQCNAAAMYYGGGLCWHFPCSLRCESTISGINQRETALNAIDLPLSRTLTAKQKCPFLWSSEGGYGFLPEIWNFETDSLDIRWTVSQELSHPLNIVDAIDRGWRLFIPE